MGVILILTIDIGIGRESSSPGAQPGITRTLYKSVALPSSHHCVHDHQRPSVPHYATLVGRYIPSCEKKGEENKSGGKSDLSKSDVQ